jgi:hypothetical protein
MDSVTAEEVRMIGPDVPVGALKPFGASRKLTLRSRCLIGRHPACDIRVDDPRISGEHASVRWVCGTWELRDLDSRNGTFVGGRRLSQGERVKLAQGSSFTVGGPDHGFTLVDSSPPIASARCSRTGDVRMVSGGLLVLPHPEHPRVTIFESTDGHWVVEADDETRPVNDHDVVVVDGDGWVLDLPSTEGATLDASGLRTALEAIVLRFRVSRDEEHVELSVVHDAGETPLPTRSHHYLLLTLARARLEDRDAPVSEQGWVGRDRLCRMLKIDMNRLNVDVFRARRQLARLGVHGAAGIILRRTNTGQLRLGTDRVEVLSL